MPLEIRELVIRAEVTQKIEPRSEQNEQEVTFDEAKLELLKLEIWEQCQEMIKEMFEEKGRR